MQARVLPFIVISQLLCTSLWFAGNAVLPGLVADGLLAEGALGPVTSAVQLGFVTGTLVFALLTVADRFRTTHVFLTSAVAGAVCNLLVLWPGTGYGSILISRFGTGFFLAGIYPVGMKIASDHYREGLGRALGFLVGALVLGTALPHLLRGFTANLPWKVGIGWTSAFAVTGGLLMSMVPQGPYRKRAAGFDPGAAIRVFRHKPFRKAAFGYFGHMWELYAFWAFMPGFLEAFHAMDAWPASRMSHLSFLVIAIGGPACVFGGLLSARFGTRKVARIALAVSGLCCLSSPFFFTMTPVAVFIAFMLCWGAAVIADSPLFSSDVAAHAPAEHRGTALTTVNCLGFAITIVSIQLLNAWSESVPAAWWMVPLALGPAAGLLSGRMR